MKKNDWFNILLILAFCAVVFTKNEERKSKLGMYGTRLDGVTYYCMARSGNNLLLCEEDSMFFPRKINHIYNINQFFYKEQYD